HEIARLAVPAAIRGLEGLVVRLVEHVVHVERDSPVPVDFETNAQVQHCEGPLIQSDIYAVVRAARAVAILAVRGIRLRPHGAADCPADEITWQSDARPDFQEVKRRLCEKYTAIAVPGEIVCIPSANQPPRPKLAIQLKLSAPAP